jgi:hypothetical protein
VLLERDRLAMRDLGQSLVNVRLRPRQIIAPLNCKLGYALVDKLARRRFDRSKIATRHARFEPLFLFGIKCDRHRSLYHKSRQLGR